MSLARSAGWATAAPWDGGLASGSCATVAEVLAATPTCSSASEDQSRTSCHLPYRLPPTSTHPHPHCTTPLLSSSPHLTETVRSSERQRGLLQRVNAWRRWWFLHRVKPALVNRRCCNLSEEWRLGVILCIFTWINLCSCTPRHLDLTFYCKSLIQNIKGTLQGCCSASSWDPHRRKAPLWMAFWEVPFA